MASRIEQIDAYLDGTLDDESAREIERLIIEDPAFVELFTERSFLHDRLHKQYALDRAAPKPSAHIADARPTAPLKHRASNTAIPLAVAAAVALVGAVVALYVLVIDPAAETDGPRGDGPPVATLIDATDTVIYEEDVANPGTEYAAGDYSIEAGTADFLLTNRVGVSLRGPTRLRMHSPMHATLSRGSAAFDCPPGVVGFTVDLPRGARVVDLGTRFSIDVGHAGDATDVRVTEGSVRIEHAALAEPTVLHAGYALRVDPTGLVVGLDRAALALVAPGFAVAPITEPTDIANDGVLIEANNIGAAGTAGGVGGSPPPPVTVNGIAFGTDQSAIVGPVDFAGSYVESDLNDADLNTLLASITGMKGAGPIRLRFDGLEPGRAYRLQLLVMLSRNSRTFVFSAPDASEAVDIPADVTRGRLVSFTFTAESETLELTVTGRPNAAGDYAPFINAYVLHEITP